jgi:hypothetical protein
MSKMLRKRLVAWFVAAASLTAILPLRADNMIGRQSQNEGIRAVPAPKTVTIDGDLGDWDLSGRIWSFADIDVRERFSVKSAAMWDPDNLYLSFLWKDPMPLNSTVDPDFNPGKGWLADAVQLRVLADRQTSWITTWYFAKKKMPVFHIAYWKDERNNKNGLEDVLLTGKAGDNRLGHGVEMAYAQLADGSGFVQEVKIPWEVVYKKAHRAQASETIRMGMEFIWGDPTGRTWPIHRYADNMQSGKTSREFFWTAKPSWGDITLLSKSVTQPREYVMEGSKPEGTVPVAAMIPLDAARFTLVIEDQDGKRIRNLAGDFSAEAFEVGKQGQQRRVEVMWDGLDDRGKLVAPGTYKVRGLTHKGLGANYEMCFYNPGTPPWHTADGSGAWGADHCQPEFLARAGDWMVVAWEFAEGGHGIIALDPTGRKRWGEKRGAAALAADKQAVYAIAVGFSSRHQKKASDKLIRMNLKNGSYMPFVRNGKKLPFEYPVSAIIGPDLPPTVLSLAAAGGRLAAGLQNGDVVVIDAQNATLLNHFPLNADVSTQVVGENLDETKSTMLLAYDGKMLYYLKSNKLTAFDTVSGKRVVIPTPGLEHPSAISLDARGNILLADMGQDQQVKAYSPAGKRVYTCARKGGRPIRGKFDPETMAQVSSVAVDAKSQVWVTENWDFPRRVSVWNRRGKLVRDYVGNTAYSGSGTFLHDQRADIAFAGQNLITLDKKEHSWAVDEILWVSDFETEQSFELSPYPHAQGHVFFSQASGKKREYAFKPAYRAWDGYVILMKRPSGWKPVAAITTVGRLAGQLRHKNGTVAKAPIGEFAHLDAYAAVIWNDANRDGRVQIGECEIYSAKKSATDRYRGEPGLPMGSGWGVRMDPQDLSFFVQDGWKYTPVGFDQDGAPIFGKAGLTKSIDSTSREFVPVPGENIVLALGGSSRADWLRGYDKSTGEIQWQYPNPYPSVHGSHRATMPKPGLLIGPLKITGVADHCGEAGRVFMLRGNLGQDFYLTTDGLYVGSMFQDGRLPGLSLPKNEAQLRGMPLEMFSMGSEPFNGWFGRQDDGVTRMTCGLPGQAGMIATITGLDQIRRFDAPAIMVDQLTLVKADRENAARLAKNTAPKAYAVAATQGRPGPRDWGKIKGVKLEREGQPVQGTAKLAWDKQNLYAQFTVNDPSPWKNLGKDVTKLFKTGDCVDIQLSPSANKGRNPVAGDLRVVISQLEGKPVAVLMQPLARSAKAAEAVTYHSPVGDKTFQKVAVLADAQVSVKPAASRYVVEAAIPWQALDMAPRNGLKLRGDCGFILSDSQGRINTARVYWANPDTNLVSDMPIEAWLAPNHWGDLSLD